jgi:hypothetical protein
MNGDQKTYRTFEEFEREELRRVDGTSLAMDDVFGEVFAEELDFDYVPARARARDDEE